MRKNEGRGKKGEGRKQKFTGERKFMFTNKESSPEKSPFKRHENEGGRTDTGAKKEGKGRKTGGSGKDLLYGILPVQGALSHRRRKLDHL